jgi:thiosulfate/3-mercaptopyruvate sulfurtransferase
MPTAMIVEAADISSRSGSVIIDCRFSLADPDEGLRLYEQGHIPGAHYLDLNRDLAGPTGEHGGRHPLPSANAFLGRLASLGIAPDTHVIAYDDSRLAFGARLWWMMRSVGFKPPQLLNGGYQAWLALGLTPETSTPQTSACAVKVGRGFSGVCDIDGLRSALERGALVVDSREAVRYQGLEEPIDPVAGHIPGAINRPWQSVTSGDGRLTSSAAQRNNMTEVLDANELVFYCGSGVTACVNLFALAQLGRDDALLYAGSWSDWCSYLPEG